MVLSSNCMLVEKLAKINPITVWGGAGEAIFHSPTAYFKRKDCLARISDEEEPIITSKSPGSTVQS